MTVIDEIRKAAACPHRSNVRTAELRNELGQSKTAEFAQCSLLSKHADRTVSVLSQQCEACMRGRDSGPSSVNDTELLRRIASQFAKPEPHGREPLATGGGKCPHLGDATGSLRECKSCKGKVRLKVYTCAKRGEVTLTDCRACADRRLTVGVVIVAHNEGRWLEDTVRCLMDVTAIDDIVVVDDGSDDGCADIVAHAIKRHHIDMPQIQLLTNDERTGCNQSRNRGGRALKSDVLIFMDAHESVSPHALRHLAEKAAAEKCITQAASRNYGIASKFRGWGGKWQTGKGGRPETVANTKPLTSDWQEGRTLLGACYAIPRDIFNRLGGFMSTTGWWGFTEAVMTMKAWLAGVKILTSRNIVARHRYQKSFERKTSTSTIERSRLAGLRICLSQETWERALPELKRGWWKPVFDKFIDCPELLAEHKVFQAVKTRTDREFFAACLPQFRHWALEAPTIKTGEVVTFTTIFGGRDRLRPLPFKPRGRAVCFTDDPTIKADGWEVRVVERQLDDPARECRQYKCVPHVWFPDAEYSLWTDACRIPVADPSDWVPSVLNGADVAMYSHPWDSNVAAHAVDLIAGGHDDEGILAKQADRYIAEGMPDTGLWAGGTILRRHTDAVGRFGGRWLAEVQTGSKRDQMSIPYALWKEGVRCVSLPESCYKNRYFDIHKHERKAK